MLSRVCVCVQDKAKFKLGIDKMVIQSGQFNTHKKSSTHERRSMLEQVSTTQSRLTANFWPRRISICRIQADEFLSACVVGFWLAVAACRFQPRRFVGKAIG